MTTEIKSQVPDSYRYGWYDKEAPINVKHKGLSPEVVREIEESERLSAANRGLTLALAVNYGSRTEIVDAVRTIGERVKIPDDLVPADARVEIEAKKAAGYYTEGSVPPPEMLATIKGRGLDE